MSSDLDQGGTYRVWEKLYLGPTVGWIMHIQEGITVTITVGGVTVVDFGDNIVEVDASAPVTIVLPSVIQGPDVVLRPISIIDISGQASVNNITILPIGLQTIMGLASLTISTDYGSYTLAPILPGITFVNGGWVQQG